MNQFKILGEAIRQGLKTGGKYTFMMTDKGVLRCKGADNSTDTTERGSKYELLDESIFDTTRERKVQTGDRGLNIPHEVSRDNKKDYRIKGYQIVARDEREANEIYECIRSNNDPETEITVTRGPECRYDPDEE